MAKRRDADDTFDSLVLDRLARWPGEAQVVVHGALGVAVRGHQPEHAVSACERLGDDSEISVRALHDLDALAQARRQAGGIACDHADRAVIMI